MTADGWSEALQRDMAWLNVQATRELDLCPEPEGLPPIGSWITAFKLDDDDQAVQVGLPHQFIGWSAGNGNLGIGCNHWRPGRAIEAAFKGSNRFFGRRLRMHLEVADAPPADACQRCLKLRAQREGVTA